MVTTYGGMEGARIKARHFVDAPKSANGVPMAKCTECGELVARPNYGNNKIHVHFVR